MVPLRRMVEITLLCFLALFAFQLLWTHDRLEHLRHLGRRGLRHRLRSGGGTNPGRHLDKHEEIDEQLDHFTITTRDGEGAFGDGSADEDAGSGIDGERGIAAGSGGGGGGEGRLHGGPGSMPNPAIILFCFNRTEYLNQTLNSLLGLAGLERYAVYVSQDGNDAAVAELVGHLAPSFLRAARGFAFWQKQPRVAQLGGVQPGHAWLAQHYKWGLDRVFSERQHSHVIIVEDDMLFSPDFLHYFEAAAPLLEADPTLWCVSSWNDNGFTRGHHWNPRKLFRTSYFPGLGWMMKRELWQELGPSWPLDHWDHWMRDEEISHGRECVCPEVNRNKNIGEVGANMNKQAFRRYLQTMDWNENVTVTDFGDLSYLLRPAYEAALRADLAAAEPWEFSYRKNAPKPQVGKTYLIPYTIERYMRVALRLKLWPYPRAHHQHVAIIPWEGARFLVADRRFCPLLPTEQQLPPTEGMRPIAGKQWQSCRDACAEHGMSCFAKDFWWLNSCAVMRKHFACERGCTIELGPDVPAYVMASNQTLHQYCLITQKASTCAAKHAATARLCACVPLKEPPLKQQHRMLAAVAGRGQAVAGGNAALNSEQQGQQHWRHQQQHLEAASTGIAAGEVG